MELKKQHGMKANAHLALTINEIMNNFDILRSTLYPSTFIRCHYRMLLFIIARKKGCSLSTDCVMPTFNQLNLNKKSSRKKKNKPEKVISITIWKTKALTSMQLYFPSLKTSATYHFSLKMI